MDVSVVVPTYNENDNIALLYEKLCKALDGLRWELIVVDDHSPDGTATTVAALCKRDARIHLIERALERGLASALIAGASAARAPAIVCMDADLQHDEAQIPFMLEAVRSKSLDLVIASRYCSGARIDGNWSPERERISKWATAIANRFAPTALTDPLSGFFMIRREAFQLARPALTGLGYKLLLDILTSASRPLNVREIPTHFRTRAHGHSKVETITGWDFFLLLLAKRFGRWIPARVISFCVIGGLGVGVHFLALSVLHRLVGISFAPAQAAATFIAMTGNFLLNNMLTYRDQRLRGGMWAKGWLRFCAICGVGAIANVGVAHTLFARDTIWWLAAAAGVLVGAVWNYAVSARYVWRRI